jgi:glycogen debranching enzyme
MLPPLDRAEHADGPSTASNSDIIEECYRRSVLLLKENARPYGLTASRECEKALCRNYSSLFARDAAISAPGMIASGDPELIGVAKAGILTLAAHQAPNGQIPNYVKPDLQEVDFWYLGCIDATLWWLIAVAFYDRSRPEDGIGRQLEEGTALALQWLLSQEHQGLFLLQQNEASDWADIMPRSGFVLYSNALWHLVKTLYNVGTADLTRRNFREVFFPFGVGPSGLRRLGVLTAPVRKEARRREFYLSFLNLSGWGEEGDILGNIMSLLCGMSEGREAQDMADALLRERIHEPYPVRVVLEPIEETSCHWRPYMKRHDQNRPWQYHNGGIWPFVGAFWVMLLARLGRADLAWNELGRVAELNRINDWEFNEWVHGKTGAPMGMPGQSWNAALFLLAFHELRARGFSSILLD